MTDTKKLDCGHEPSPHSEHTTGTVHIDGLGKVCWECGNVWEADQLRTAQQWSAYMVMEFDSQYRLTNWAGHPIGTITSINRHRGNFGNWVYTFRAIIQGANWYGRGTGHGMLCHLRRAKH